MKAKVRCDCGYELHVDQSLFGSDLQCPGCGSFVFDARSDPAAIAGQDVVRSHSEQQIHAPPSEEKLPFFKFSRRKMLKGELDRLTEDGEYSETDHDALIERAAKLGLDEKEIDKLRL